MNNKSLYFSNNLVLSIIFILGLYFSKDFGITWDEPYHRLRGLQILSFLAKKLSVLNIPEILDYTSVLNSSHYFYGAFFEVTSAVIEKLFFIHDKKKYFHYATWIKLFFSIFFWFLLLFSIYKRFF